MVKLITTSSKIIFLIFSLLSVANTTIEENPGAMYTAMRGDGTKATSGLSEKYANNVLELFFDMKQVSLFSSDGWFYNTTVGHVPNKVYGTYYCRGDLPPQNCSDCISSNAQNIQLEFFMTNRDFFQDWYGFSDECMIHFANHSIYGFVELDDVFLPGPSGTKEIMPNMKGFNETLSDTIDNLINIAPKSSKKFALKTVDVIGTSDHEKLYALVQCTPDISSRNCSACLKNLYSNFQSCCGGNRAGLTIYAGCMMKYNNQSFFYSNNTYGSKKKQLKLGIIAAIASAAFLGLLFLVVCLCLFLRRTQLGESFKKRFEATQFTNILQDGTMEDIGSLEALQVDFAVVKAATCNFSEENKLGQGGFGEVYKGKFSSGQVIAVKRLSKNSQQGNVEFKNEVVFLAKLQHRNLVRLLGFCLLREEKILIYEFLTNSSLDRFLYNPEKRASLDWETRFKIITGIARGLLYLHEDSRLKIIHRDLKVSNILLDEAMNAKIADFGLAKLFDLDQTQGDTMRIAGTYGYMAPEYALAGQFSVKSDAYSFGVIVLEIVSGQRNTFFKQESDEGLIHRAWRLWNEDTILNLVDPLLENKYSEEEAKLCIHIGLLCIQEDAAYRPRMATVVAAMNGQAITLPVPNVPHYYAVGTMNDYLSSSNYDSLLRSEAQHSKSDHNDGEHIELEEKTPTT